eukprot:369127-Amorphochlora_amoeboformis.AAC.1
MPDFSLGRAWGYLPNPNLNPNPNPNSNPNRNPNLSPNLNLIHSQTLTPAYKIGKFPNLILDRANPNPNTSPNGLIGEIFPKPGLKPKLECIII